MSIRHPGRFRSWRRLVFSANRVQSTGIPTTPITSDITSDIGIGANISANMGDPTTTQIPIGMTIPNHHCLREIRPRKLKRKCKSAFTRKILF